MNFNLEDAVALLARTPRTLDSLLRDLPDGWTQSNEGQGTWSPFEVVGHLISGEHTDWMPRVRMILEQGDTKTFEPFDRGGYEQEARDKSLPQLLEEFSRLRNENLDQLRKLQLQPDDLARRGRHPDFGVVTLSQLLATWVVHDLTHLHQISRTLAHQYGEAVGPWEMYLGVLHCQGHSAAG